MEHANQRLGGMGLMGKVMAFCVIISLAACGGEGPSGNQGYDLNNNADSAQSSEVIQDSIKERSLEPAGTTVQDTMIPIFASQYPLLSNLTKNKPALQQALTDFTSVSYYKTGLDSEEAIKKWLKVRDETLIPGLQPLIESMDEEYFYQNEERIYFELEELGIVPVTAEGMFISLQKGAVFEVEIAEYASEPFQLSLDFQEQFSYSMGGEYPFNNQSERLEMVEIGERMKKEFPESIYTKEILEDYQQVVHDVTDMHIMKDGDYETPLVFGMSTEFYPYASELESHEKFVESNTESGYKDVISKILENTSRIDATAEEVYLLYLEWHAGFESAKNKVFEYLEAGKDIPHYIEISRNNGQKQYAVCYRFYSDLGTAEAEFKKAKGIYPDLKLLRASERDREWFEAD